MKFVQILMALWIERKLEAGSVLFTLQYILLCVKQFANYCPKPHRAKGTRGNREFDDTVYGEDI